MDWTMKKIKFIIVGILVILISVLFFVSENSQIGFIKSCELYDGTNLFSWFESQFMLKNGLVRNKIGGDQKFEQLSETQGLYLQLLAQKKEISSFRKVYQATKKNLGEEGLFHWKKGEKTNALLDDFRIVKALRMAYEKSGDSYYERELDEIQNALLDKNTINEGLVSFFDLDSSEKPNYIDCSFLDVEGISICRGRNPLWENIYEHSSELLKETKENQFSIRYSYEDGFENGGCIHTAEYLYLLIHLQQVDKSTSQWLEKQAEGKIYGTYDGTGNPISKVESAAVYSLAAKYFYRQDNLELAKKLQKRSKELLEQAILNYQEEQSELYAFDILEFLLAEVEIGEEL